MSSLHRQGLNTPQFIIPMPVEKLVELLQRQLLPPNENHTKEWFDWQTFPLTSFFAGMVQIRERLGPGRHKFVDVGSGIGTKLFLADSIGFEPYGIEHRSDYVAVSRGLFPEYRVWCEDALKFTHYEQFDVIYSYRLARHDELQNRVNEHILQFMREDAIFFANDTQGSLDQLPTNGVETL